MQLRISLIPCLILFCLPSLLGQYEVKVLVPNVKVLKGSVMVCLVDQKSDFLKNCFKNSITEVKEQENITVFEAVPPGQYAISIFHDKNNDQKLNTNFIGIPKEPYGFSNNPTAMFGPPSYEKCLFDVKSNMTISIKL